METEAAFSHDTARGAALSDAALARHLEGVALDCEQVEETGSTNSDLMARARAAALVRPVLRVAQRQTQGRGRRGRRWHGAEAGSLLFSLALPWQRTPAESTAVTLACGLAVAALLREHLPAGGARIRVKWPNDILLDDGKLAGILVELAEDPAGARTLVIGLGINLATDAALRARVAGDAGHAGPPEGSAPGDACPAAAVADLAMVLGDAAARTQRELWLARLGRALLDAAQRFERDGFADGPAAFAACCAYLGEPVDVHGAAGAPTAGILRGVDARGHLLIDSAQGMQALSSGEVSMRAQHPAPAGPDGARA
jgi:BirA family biotin operon repressor/biotin-[acetyl-CoA-carboxylase] ligase